MSSSIYRDIQKQARRIVACSPTPSFYRVHASEWECSCQFLNNDPAVRLVLDFVVRQLENDFGHGFLHARKVAIDAGTLAIVESRHHGVHPSEIATILRNAQIAGLLHDIKRKERHHAIAGSNYAEQVMQAFGFMPEAIATVSLAIRNHEAFQKPALIDTEEGRLVSDCLYDADKFRWGPDNFEDTLWDMLDHLDPPFPEFLRRYPSGMEFLARIKTTFRTETGRRFGPEFIDIGLAIGEVIYRMIEQEYT
ncbi:MAG: hypothetical protein AB1547_13245 [Thermodesulfobacteriota bacterium]